MDKGDIIVYYCKLLKYKKLIYPLPPDFGLKSDWSRYLDESKYKDKNLLDFIDFLINSGMLIEYGIKNEQHKIYRPTNSSLDKVQEMLEKNTVFMWIDDTFDVERNPKKGSRLL